MYIHVKLIRIAKILIYILFKVQYLIFIFIQPKHGTCQNEVEFFFKDIKLLSLLNKECSNIIIKNKALKFVSSFN